MTMKQTVKSRTVANKPVKVKQRSAVRAPRPYMSPLALYRANPIARIEMARERLPALYLRVVAGILHASQDWLNRRLNIPRSAMARRGRDDKLLSQTQSERLIGLMMLIGQVETIMKDAGDNSVELDAGKWLSDWMEEPLPALGNRTAGEFMDTAEGQQLVSRMLAQSVAGAYV